MPAIETLPQPDELVGPISFQNVTPKTDWMLADALLAFYRDEEDPDITDKRSKRLSQAAGAVGALPALDTLCTVVSNLTEDTDDYRQEAAGRLDDAIVHIGGRVSANDERVIVCRRTDEDYGNCVATSQYNMTTRDGVEGFVKDEIFFVPSQLKGAEQGVLIGAVSSASGEGPSTPASDAALLGRLQEAADAYVADVPDKPDETISAVTPLGFGLGAVLLVAGIVTTVRASRARQRVHEDVARANDNLCTKPIHLTADGKTLSLDRGEHYLINNIRQSVNPERRVFYDATGARQVAATRVQAAIDTAIHSHEYFSSH